MSKSNTAVKKNRHLIAITIIVVLSCLIIVAATSIGVTVTKANGKKLSFDVDGQAVATIRVTSNEEVVLPTPEQKIGYTFSGWYFDKDTFTEPCTEETIKEKKFKSGTSVHAKWLKNDYTITYNLDSGENAKTNPNGYVIDTATIALVNPFKLGFTFDGWYSEDTFTTKVTEIAAGSTGDKTLFAKWIKNEFSIIYKNLEGATNNALNPGGYDVTTATIALADASRDGYTFDGWYDANIGGNKVTEITTGSTGEKTIFARWKAIEYGIVYNLNGGVNAIANPNTYTIDNATALAAPTREGYTFEGWFAKADFSGNAITEIAKGSMDAKTLFAKWSLTNYDITYELNGQFVDNPNVVTNYHIFSSTMTLKNASRNGYTFEGWYDANVGGSAVTEITKGSTGNKTIFARWKVVEYTITYNLDGGINGDNPNTYNIESDTIVFDKPTKLGYTFDGWYDAKAVANSFDNIMTGSTGNATVYAKWTASIYSVAYILTDANNDHGNITLYKASDSKQTLKKPTSNKNWLAFVGWFDAPTGGNEVTTIGGGALGNLTLYDRWDFVGTTGLGWNKSDDGTTWEVSKGGVSNGIVGIPSKHNNDGLPVRIKANGFENANGITSVIIDDGVTSIESRAFRNCSALARITIPNSVTSIGVAVFQNGTGLTSVVIPNNVTEIASQTFAGCGNLVSVTIPDSVQSILSEAFYLCPKLASIDIPNSVTSIGSSAFNSCTALKSVNIPSLVTEIGAQAFYNCTGLISVNIPSKVTSIGASAFSICSNLASVYIPASVDTMGSTAFGGCVLLTIYCEIAETAVPPIVGGKGWQANWYGTDVDPATEIKWSQFLSTDGFIYEADGSNYKVTGSVGLSGAVTIPSTFNNRPVTSIGEKAFYYQEGITSVVIPDSVTSIGKQAFSNCKALTSVNIPSSVTAIGELAFLNCYALTSVVLPKDLKGIGGQTFQNCEALVSLNMPKGLLDIGEYAFRSCISLTSLNIPDTVTNIGELAISNCTKIKSIFIPKSVINIGANAFQSSSSITIYFERSSSTDMTLDSTWNSDGRPVVWGKIISEDGFICVSDGADGYKVMGHSNPTGALVIPEKVNGKFVTTIGREAFIRKSAITSVVIPESVKTIEPLAFQECTSLKSVKLPENLTTLGEQIFYQCNALTSINIPNGVTKIEPNLLSYTAITSIVIPSGVKSIGAYAFSNCTSLTSVNIPSGVTTIGSYAFLSCAKLPSIYIPSSVATIGDNVFKSCSIVRIHSEVASAPVYNSSLGTGWSTAASNAWNQDINSYYITWNQIASEDGYFYRLNTDGTYAVSGHINSKDALVIPETFNKKNVTTIAEYAFFNQKGLTSVVIPSKVTSIGHLAFQECAALVSVTIPEGMITIDYQAFYVCQSLTYINIPSTVTSIGSHAFGSCPKIIRVFIPRSVERVYINAFYDCTTTKIYCEIAQSEATSPNWDVKWAQNVPAANILWNQSLSADGLIYEAVNVGGVDSYKVTGSEKLSGEVVIPEKFNGRPVTSIGYKAFYNQADITSVVIPKGVTSIGEQAFMGCTKLANVVIPEGVKTLDTQAFQYCEKLTVVTLPSTLLTINANAFYGCKLLSSINIPSMVETIGSNTFNSCVSLTNIYIPYSVITIGSNTFYNCPNIQVYCERTGRPGNWYYDGTNGVYWNGNTPTDKVHWGLIPSGDGWFYKDEGIGGYTVAGGVNLVGEVSIPRMFNGRVVSKIASYAFFDENEITSIVIPDTVTTIGQLAFYSCDSLKSVVIPDSVTNIPHQAFRFCSKLTSVVIPDGVTVIESYAFDGCNALTSVTIPNGVKTIYGFAFQSCSSLTSIFIPKTVTTIGEYAFNGCTKLIVYVESNGNTGTWGNSWNAGVRGATFSQMISEDGLIFQLNGDGYMVTGSAKVSGDIVIPSSFNGKIVNRIDSYAFKGYVGITSVTIPDSVKTIGSYAFSGCSALKSVKMATGVQTIGTQAFYDCSALTSVNIPSSVTSIGVNAFMNCTKLPKIFIPKSVATMAQDVFYNCTNLKVYCETLSAPNAWHGTWYGANVDPATDIKWGQILTEDGSIYEEDGKGGYILNIGGNVSGDIVIGTLYGRPVTSIADNAFQGNTGITSVVIQNGVTSIGASAFESCTSLKCVNIPNSVTTIEAGTFWNCNVLTSVVIPDSVTSIGQLAFYSCDSLKSIVISNGVTSIGIQAFRDCTSLTSVNIPNGVTTIEDETFYNCSSLTSVNIPSGVTSIGANAFQSCEALTNVNIPNSVTSIGQYAFAYCTTFIIVNIPSSVTSIGRGAFFSCTSLTSIYIPNTVTTMGVNAFDSCKNIAISCQATSKPNGWDAKWMGNVKDTNITWNVSVPVVKP